MAAEKRLEIADSILSTQPHHRQALASKLQALVDLHEYEAAGEMLKGEAASFVDQKWPAIIRRLLLESTGCFDLSSYILGLRGKAPKFAEFLPLADDRKAPEFAQFVSDAVLVRSAKAMRGGGRGMFTSGRCIRQGELILVDHCIGPVLRGSDAYQQQYLLDAVDKAIRRSPKERLKVAALAPAAGIPAMELFLPNQGRRDSYRSEEQMKGPLIEILERKPMIGTFLELDSAGRLAPIEKAGLWPLVGFINHSCDPNAALFIVGDALFLKSVRDIPVGEQIFICYCDPAMPMVARHRVIGFTCNCDRCQFETKFSKNLQRASEQWVENSRLAAVSDPGGEAAVVATVKQVQTAAAKMDKMRDKMWLTTTFFAAYKLELYPLELSEAIDTHLNSSTAGNAFALRCLVLRDVKGRFQSELLTAAKRCFPPCSQESLLELLDALRNLQRPFSIPR